MIVINLIADLGKHVGSVKEVEICKYERKL